MTVSVPGSLVYSYSGNGATTAFSYPVRFLSNAELVVVLEDADGVQTTKALTTHYTVSGADDDDGGTVTMLAAPAAGETLYIYRQTTNQQLADLADRARNPAATVEKQLDRMVMALQDLGDQFRRGVKAKVGQDGVEINADGSEGQTLVFGADGNLVPGADQSEIQSAQGYAEQADQSRVDAEAARDQTVAAANSVDAATLGNGLIKVTDAAYAAVGDGGTDTTSAVASAVAAAYAAGAELYWPAGTYLTTANIPNLHSVRHRGPGVIKRGTALFGVHSEAAANTLYVATTGSDTNDGLSSGQALASIQRAFDILAHYAPLDYGQWTVEIAAGTYNKGATLKDGLRSDTRIIIRGPDTAGAQPTAIIDGTSISDRFGFWFSGNAFIEMHDLFLRNFNQAGGYGILVNRGQWDINLFNVWADNNDIGGGFIGTGIVQWKYGKVSNNLNIGLLAQDRARYTFGWGGEVIHDGSGVFTGQDGLWIVGNSRGVDLSRLSYGYVRSCRVESNYIGLYVHKLTRTNAYKSKFIANGTPISAYDRSLIDDEGGVTYESNTNPNQFRGFATISSNGLNALENLGISANIGAALGSYAQPAATGSWVQHVPAFATVPANTLKNTGRDKLKITATGTIAKAAAASGREYYIRIYLGGDWVALMSLPSDVAMSGRFVLTADIVASSSTAQKGVITFSLHGGASYVNIVSGTANMVSGDRAISIWINRTASGDNVVFDYVSAEMFGSM